MDGGSGTGAPANLAAADFFISRTGADATVAGVIGGMLEDAGHKVILQQWDFANRNFMEAMHTALASKARVIALVSPEYMGSQHCLAEALNAIGHDPLNTKGRLIVMRVAECAPSGLFTALAYWDLVPIRDNAAALRDIVLTAIRPGRHKNAIAAQYWREARTIVHRDIHAVPNFTGRLPDLAALDAALWAGGGGTVAITQAAVQGLGGVGKSVLAVQYAWENRARYAGVWRLIAETRSQVLDGLIELGAQFIPGLAEVQDREEAARMALALIAGGGFAKPWLLIYDNVETPAVLNGLTPTGGAEEFFAGRDQTSIAAQVLITTRWPDWTGRAAPVPLGVFTPEEAVAFLITRTGRTDAAGAARLAEALGRLPVALDHAAAFCVETGDSFDDYGKQLAEWISHAPEAADYPRTVFATFSLAMEQAAAKCPEAETLMGVLAWMAPDAIPRDILNAADAMTLRRAVGALAKVSLLTVTAQDEAAGGPMLGVHRLVQLVVRGRLAAEGADNTAAIALRLVTSAFPFESHDVRTWSACARLLPHARAVLETVPENRNMAADAAALLNQTAIYLGARADYAEAVQLLRRALAIKSALYPDDHPDVAVNLNNLAWFLQVTQNFAEAESLLRQALRINIAAYGPDHSVVAANLSNLGWLLLETDHLVEAESLLRDALRISEAAHGPDHPSMIRILCNLGSVLQATNRAVEAEQLFRRALVISETSYGLDHPDVALSLNNLARLLLDTGRLGEAEPLMRQALRINEAAYGPDHPHVATNLDNLGRILGELGHVAEAEQSLRRALAIDEAIYGSDHSALATHLNNLAHLLQRANRFTEAEPLIRRALAIDEATYGHDHPEVADDLHTLAALLQATNRPAEAVRLMRRALTIAERSYGEEHPSVALRLNNLASFLQISNRHAEAEPLYRRAVAIVEASLPEHHPTAQLCRANLARLLAEMGGDQPHASAGPSTASSIARNAPCACGSGQRYKHCCGRMA